MTIVPFPPLPGTKYLSHVGAETYFCNAHKMQVTPVVIAEGSLTFRACGFCIEEELGKDIPEAEATEVRVRTWKDVDDWENVCSEDGCFNEVGNNFCYVCQTAKCDKDMWVKGSFGLCQRCKEAGHEAIK